jgi:RimK family alpha-L-glutamate ligase
MRISILGSGGGWHVRDLLRAAARLGHDAAAVDFRRITASLAHGPDSLAGHDAVIVRTMPPGSLEQVVFRMDALHRLRQRGVTVLNPPAALEACVDKYLAGVRLESAGLPIPATVVCQHADDAMAGLESLGGDVVVKPLFGSEGRGMVRVSDPDTGWRVFRTLERLQTVLYLQRFVPHPGWDLRVFVIGGRVLTAMRRYARDGWRTNVAQGGRAEAVDVSADEARLALRAAESVGAPVAGVDLLPGPGGEWYVLEVNAVPGWRALAPATGVDVAAAIVQFVAEYRGE